MSRRMREISLTPTEATDLAHAGAITYAGVNGYGLSMGERGSLISRRVILTAPPPLTSSEVAKTVKQIRAERKLIARHQENPATRYYDKSE